MIYTEHREFRGLMDDVLKHWAEDWPRLVLADWCDDNGEDGLSRLLRYDLLIPLERRGVETVVWWLAERGGKGLDDDALALAVRAASRLADDAECCFLWRGFVTEVGLTLESWEKNGRRLAGDHPLRQVWLTDREPQRWRTRYGWCKGHDELVDSRFHLYAKLWDGLRGGKEDPVGNPYPIWRYYSTHQLAFAALSAACLRVARTA